MPRLTQDLPMRTSPRDNHGLARAICAPRMFFLKRKRLPATHYRLTLLWERATWRSSGLFNCMTGIGRNEEALEQTRRAVVLNPLDSNAAANLGFDNYTARKYDVAIQEFQKVLKFDPDNVGVHVGLGWVYEQKKMYPEAIVELQKAVTLSHRNELTLASLGQVLAESGRRQEAAKILQELKHRSEQRYISPCLLAMVQIGLGERDQAIASLEQAYDNRDQWMLYLKVDPHMDSLRTDPRFQDLVRRVGIPA